MSKIHKFVVPILLVVFCLFAARQAFADGPDGSVTIGKMSGLPQPVEGTTPVFENAGHISGGRPDKSLTRFPPYLPPAVVVEKAREGIKLHAHVERSASVEQVFLVQPELGGYWLSFSQPRELTEEMYFAVRISQDGLLSMSSTSSMVSSVVRQDIPGLKYGVPTFVGFLVREDLGRRVRIWARVEWPVEIQLAGESGHVRYDPVERGITGDRNTWFAVKAPMGRYKLYCVVACQLHVAPRVGDIGADYLVQGEVELTPDQKYRVENTDAAPGNHAWDMMPDK